MTHFNFFFSIFSFLVAKKWKKYFLLNLSMDRRVIFCVLSGCFNVCADRSQALPCLFHLFDTFESMRNCNNNMHRCYLSDTFSLWQADSGEKNDEENEDLLVAVESVVGTFLDSFNILLDWSFEVGRWGWAGRLEQYFDTRYELNRPEFWSFCGQTSTKLCKFTSSHRCCDILRVFHIPFSNLWRKKFVSRKYLSASKIISWIFISFFKVWWKLHLLVIKLDRKLCGLSTLC